MNDRHDFGEEGGGEHSSPPVAPAADERPDDDSAFVAECRASFRTLPSSERWTLTAELLTHDDRWGRIWRADFELDDQSFEPLVNRLVIWRHTDGTLPVVVAIGQRVTPLRPGARHLA